MVSSALALLTIHQIARFVRARSCVELRPDKSGL